MKKTKTWRRSYIRLLKEGPRPTAKIESRDEESEQVDLMVELIRDGYAAGVVTQRRGEDGDVTGKVVTWDGPTAKGRIFLDDMEDKEQKASWRNRVQNFLLLVCGGVITYLGNLFGTDIREWIIRLL